MVVWGSRWYLWYLFLHPISHTRRCFQKIRGIPQKMDSFIMRKPITPEWSPLKMYILFLYKICGTAPHIIIQGGWKARIKDGMMLGGPPFPTRWRRCLITLAMALRDVLPPFAPSTFATLAWPGGKKGEGKSPTPPWHWWWFKQSWESIIYNQWLFLVPIKGGR